MAGTQYLGDAGCIRGIVEVAHDDDFSVRNDVEDGIDLMSEEGCGAVAGVHRFEFASIFRGPVVHEAMEGVLVAVTEFGVEDIARNHFLVVGIVIRDGFAVNQLKKVLGVYDGWVDAASVRSVIMYPPIVELFQGRQSEECVQHEVVLHFADPHDAYRLPTGEGKDGFIEVVPFSVEPCGRPMLGTVFGEVVIVTGAVDKGIKEVLHIPESHKNRIW